jgi:hypothetical protein
MASDSPAASPARASRTAGGDMHCHRVTIEPAENGGFSLEAHMRSTGRSKSGLGDPYCPPKTYVFESMDGLVGQLGKLFGAKGKK